MFSRRTRPTRPKKMTQKLTNNMAININVPAHLYAEIDAHAVRICTTKAAIVRKILVEWLQKLETSERLSNRVE
jgi:predicted DNA-binding protein